MVGSFLTFGPLGGEWGRMLSDPNVADLVGFVTLILPVILYFGLSEASAAGATWGKRKAGLRVAGPPGGTLSLPRSLVRSGLKFLPWQMAHSAMFHIPGFPLDPGEPPAWSPILLGVAWALVILHGLGLTPLLGRRTLYDRVSGATVVETGRG